MGTDSSVLVKAYRGYLSDEKARSAVGVVEKMGGGAAGEERLDFPGAAKMVGGEKIQDGARTNRLKPYLSDETPRGS